MENQTEDNETQRVIDELKKFDDIPPLFEAYREKALSNLEKRLESNCFTVNPIPLSQQLRTQGVINNAEYREMRDKEKQP